MEEGITSSPDFDSEPKEEEIIEEPTEDVILEEPTAEDLELEAQAEVLEDQDQEVGDDPVRFISTRLAGYHCLRPGMRKRWPEELKKASVSRKSGVSWRSRVKMRLLRRFS